MHRLSQCDCLIVDVCGTVVGENTTYEFIGSLPYRGWRRVIRRVALSRVVGRLATWLMPSFPRSLLLFSTRGLPQESLAASARAYVGETLRRSGNNAVLRAIEQFRQRNAPVLMASASLEYIVAELAATLGCRGYVASRLALRAGRSTGFLMLDATGRKLELLRAAYPEVLQRKCAVITDNREDGDLLRHAAAAVFIVPAGQRELGSRIGVPQVEVWEVA